MRISSIPPPYLQTTASQTRRPGSVSERPPEAVRVERPERHEPEKPLKDELAKLRSLSEEDRKAAFRVELIDSASVEIPKPAEKPVEPHLLDVTG